MIFPKLVLSNETIMSYESSMFGLQDINFLSFNTNRNLFDLLL